MRVSAGRTAPWGTSRTYRKTYGAANKKVLIYILLNAPAAITKELKEGELSSPGRPLVFLVGKLGLSDI